MPKNSANAFVAAISRAEIESSHRVHGARGPAPSRFRSKTNRADLFAQSHPFLGVFGLSCRELLLKVGQFLLKWRKAPVELLDVLLLKRGTLCLMLGYSD